MRPSRKAAAASSLAALYTAVRQPPRCPPPAPARRPGRPSSSSGSNSQVEAVRKSHASAAAGTRAGQPSASAIGSFMSGGLAWAIVEPSVNVTIECTIDCGWTTTSMRSYGDAEQQVGLDQLEALVDQRRRVQRVHRAHRPGRMRAGLLGGDVFESVGGPAAERAARRGEHDLGHLVGGAAAQALGHRRVLGVDGHDLARLGRLEHQRTARDQRFLVGQRQPGARWPARPASA